MSDVEKFGGPWLPVAARTATTPTTVIEDRTHPGARFFLNVSANPGGAETLTVSIEMVDPNTPVSPGALLPAAAGRQAITAYPATAANTNGNYVYELHPGAAETAATPNHEVQAGSLPSYFRAVVTHSAGGSWTYSLAYDLLQ